MVTTLDFADSVKLWLSRASAPGSFCATDSSCWSDLPLPDEEQDFGSSVEFVIPTLFIASFFFFCFFKRQAANVIWRVAFV